MNRSSAKVKTSITISLPLLVEIDKRIGERASRSAFIEKVLRDHLRDEAINAVHQRDLELINANADYLNREAMDVLRYQAPIEWTTEDD
jgi:metal-responsive CopG/Arc/MetJ family transcriptional regulator